MSLLFQPNMRGDLGPDLVRVSERVVVDPTLFRGWACSFKLNGTSVVVTTPSKELSAALFEFLTSQDCNAELLQDVCIGASAHMQPVKK